ncbi:oxidoreductase [Paenibacillus fonticola]|uniref:oxidoreductase n=1 Tax=Paenibacillus fonticola TaxID=379896 RepID=UPI0003658410|nr:oxidoreductase [Paenibacillus fonticola]
MRTKWTSNDIPALTGRTAIVTGANAGLGYQISEQLARNGAHVIMACRDERKGEIAIRQLYDKLGGVKTELVPLDLADLSSIHKFASLVSERHSAIDLLVNNAGVMATPPRKTADGFELQIGTNHLGHFALTGLLLPQLAAAGPARIVTLSSIAHRIGRINFKDLQHERSYNAELVYGQSKLANLLFAFELQRRIDEAGLNMLSVAAHPGIAATNLFNVGPQMSGSRMQTLLYGWITRYIAQPEQMGALPALYAATSPDVKAGRYYGPDRFGIKGFPGEASASIAARNRDNAQRLWNISEQLTKVIYPFVKKAVT